MDLNNLTAIGRSWVGNVCQKFEGVFQEVDAIVKQNKLDAERGQATSKKVKILSAEVVRLPPSLLRPQDELLDGDKSAGTSSIDGLVVNVEHKPIQVENLPVNVDENAVHTTNSLANAEDRPVQVDNSPVNFVEKPVWNNSEHSEAELDVPEEDNFDPQSRGPDALSLSDDLASADRSEGQLEKICEFNTVDCENRQDGEEAGASHHAVPIPEHPPKEAESGMCQGNSRMIVAEAAMDEESAASDVKPIPPSAEESSDASECIQFLYEDACGSEAELFVASSVQEMETLCILSHDETDHAALSEPSAVTFSEEQNTEMGFESLSNPLVVQSIGNSSSFCKSFFRKCGSLDISFHAEESDPDSSSLLASSLLNATDNPGDDFPGFDMETVLLNDEAEELDANGDSIDSKELYALSLRVQNGRSFKNKLRDAFTPKKRLAKEYKHLGIWYGDIDIRLAKETQPTPSTSASSLCLDSKNPRKHEPIESEWVLL